MNMETVDCIADCRTDCRTDCRIDCRIDEVDSTDYAGTVGTPVVGRYVEGEMVDCG